MKLKVILIFVFLFVLCNLTITGATKDDVYSELVNIYKHVQQVSFTFRLLEEDFSGSLTAKKGNKYKMIVDDRLIISNGKTIWNYSPKDNKVVISDTEEMSAQVSIDKIFFSFMENFKPISMKEASTSKGISAFVLTLKADEKFKTLMHISTVEIWIDKGNYDILQFHITEPQKMTWLISKLKLRKKSEDKLFEFEPNKDCKVIDLR